MVASNSRQVVFVMGVDIANDARTKMRGLADFAVGEQKRITEASTKAAAQRQTTDQKAYDRAGVAADKAFKKESDLLHKLTDINAKKAADAQKLAEKQQRANDAVIAKEIAARDKAFTHLQAQTEKEEAARAGAAEEAAKAHKASVDDRLKEAQGLGAKFAESSKLVSEGMMQIARGAVLMNVAESGAREQALELWAAFEGGAAIIKGMQHTVKGAAEAWEAYTVARKAANAAESAGAVIKTMLGGPTGIGLAAGAAVIGGLMYAFNASSEAARKQAEALKASQDRIKAFGEAAGAAAEHLKSLRDINYKARGNIEDVQAHAGVDKEEGDIKAARDHAKRVQDALEANAQSQHELEIQHESELKAAAEKQDEAYARSGYGGVGGSGGYNKQVRDKADAAYTEDVGKSNAKTNEERERLLAEQAKYTQEQIDATKQVSEAEAAAETKRLSGIAQEVEAAQNLTQAAHEAVKATEDAVKAERDKYKSAAQKFGQLDHQKQRLVADATRAVRHHRGTREQEQLVLDYGDKHSQDMVNERQTARGTRAEKRNKIYRYRHEDVFSAEGRHQAAQLHERSAQRQQRLQEEKAAQAGLGDKMHIHADVKHTFEVKIKSDADARSQRLADKLKPWFERQKHIEQEIQNQKDLIAKQGKDVDALKASQLLNKSGSKNNAKLQY